MGSSEHPILQSLLNLEADLQQVFERLASQVHDLQKDVQGGARQEQVSSDWNVPSERVPIAEPAAEELEYCISSCDSLCEQCDADEWVGAVAAEPVRRQTSLLQQSTKGGLDQPQLRLSPLLMELSMKSKGALNHIDRHKIRESMEGAASRSRPIMKPTAQILEEVQHCRTCGVLAPESRPRVLWDLCGAILILIDVFVSPASIAWELEVTPLSHDIFLALFSWASLIFWSMDIIMNFNTAFYSNGTLRVRRREIARNYISSWLLFDAGVVALDFFGFVSDSQGEDANYVSSFRTARILRVLRALRVVRIVKASRLNVMAENMVIAIGRQWLIMAFGIVRMLIEISMVVHALACAWFGVGKVLSSDPQVTSWLVLNGVLAQPAIVQYIHALQWIIQPPSPAPLDPASGVERFMQLVNAVTTVLVIGTALSLLTGTLQEIRSINEEMNRKRRELRIYLHAQSAPTKLVMRVMSFADYKLARYSSVSYDPLLFSPKLQAELAVWQNRHLLEKHPLFELTSSVFPKVFAEICRVIQKNLYHEAEAVFSLGLLAEHLYITNDGAFAVVDHRGDLQHFENEVRHFAEVALYADVVMHDCTLRASSFAEVFTLSTKQLVSVLTNAPICASMFIDYAKDYMLQYSLSMVQPDRDVISAEMDCAVLAAETNPIYLEMELHTHKLLKNMNLAAVIDSSKPDKRLSPGGFMDFVLGDEPMESLLDKLYRSYIESDPSHGLHALFEESHGHQGGQERVESSCVSLAALVRGDLEAYAYPQRDDVRITSEQWQQLQRILHWTSVDQDKLQAVFFLLVAHAIGKYRAVSRQLAPEHQKPEAALLHILDFFPNAVPTAELLSLRAQYLLRDVLQLATLFNFAQMLQAENVPGNVLSLQKHLASRDHPQDLLQVYMLYMLGFISGLAGGLGSRFMNRHNARGTLLGLTALQHILDKDPKMVYWSYVQQRCQLLGLQAQQPEDLALGRLACLCRVQGEGDYCHILRAWHQLSSAERWMLTKHFVANGITTNAIVFEFLPLCLEHARKNPFVTVQTLLEVLVELIQVVQAAVKKSHSRGHRAVHVELSDLAAFIMMVQNSYIFQSCLLRSKLRFRDPDYILELTQENWGRVGEPQSDVTAMANSLRGLWQLQKVSNETAAQARSENPPAST
ncbi:KCNH5 [Symbiodinium natans]|uniref:KCNH5 protein n=1 Tax=Symbiodinium natans TaxID=878477 RepID=A0A812HTR2_9DINO|nr:KCNH5 [Symbiodinium natans]